VIIALLVVLAIALVLAINVGLVALLVWAGAPLWIAIAVVLVAGSMGTHVTVKNRG
jgi:hypothetical protein